MMLCSSQDRKAIKGRDSLSVTSKIKVHDSMLKIACCGSLFVLCFFHGNNTASIPRQSAWHKKGKSSEASDLSMTYVLIFPDKWCCIIDRIWEFFVISLRLYCQWSDTAMDAFIDYCVLGHLIQRLCILSIFIACENSHNHMDSQTCSN